MVDLFPGVMVVAVAAPTRNFGPAAEGAADFSSGRVGDELLFGRLDVPPGAVDDDVLVGAHLFQLHPDPVLDAQRLEGDACQLDRVDPKRIRDDLM